MSAHSAGVWTGVCMAHNVQLSDKTAWMSHWTHVEILKSEWIGVWTSSKCPHSTQMLHSCPNGWQDIVRTGVWWLTSWFLMSFQIGIGFPISVQTGIPRWDVHRHICLSEQVSWYLIRSQSGFYTGVWLSEIFTLIHIYIHMCMHRHVHIHIPSYIQTDRCKNTHYDWCLDVQWESRGMFRHPVVFRLVLWCHQVSRNCMDAKLYWLSSVDYTYITMNWVVNGSVIVICNSSVYCQLLTHLLTVSCHLLTVCQFKYQLSNLTVNCKSSIDCVVLFKVYVSEIFILTVNSATVNFQ